MTKEQTTKIMAIMYETTGGGFEEAVVNIWHMCFKDMAYETAEKAALLAIRRGFYGDPQPSDLSRAVEQIRRLSEEGPEVKFKKLVKTAERLGRERGAERIKDGIDSGRLQPWQGTMCLSYFDSICDADTAQLMRLRQNFIREWNDKLEAHENGKQLAIDYGKGDRYPVDTLSTTVLDNEKQKRITRKA